MKKKLLFLIFVLCIFIKIPNVSAVCSVGVSSAKSAVVGNTFTVSTTVSSDVGSWYYVLSYDPSKVQLISGNTKVVGVKGDSRTNTYKFKALKSGTVTFKATNVSLASDSTNAQCSASSGSSSIVMKTQAEIEESYSRNNNLGSLTVDGAELTPAFSPDITEYSVTLPVDTTKAKVIATAQDSTASIQGGGELDVVDGLNKVEIVVTAQHGEKKTYVVNLTVQELDPVKVKVDNKDYTVVRKKGQVENIPTGFVESKITIENQEVVSYVSDITKITLLALKDSEGLVDLFIYDEKTKEFSTFYEAKSTGLNLIILDSEKEVLGFVKTEFKYNNKTIKGYKVDGGKDDNYYLVYAQNLESGGKYFYLYDSRENTFQRYFTDLDDIRLEDIKIREYIIIGFLGLFGFLILIKFFKSLCTKERKIKRLEKKLSKLKSKVKKDYYYEIEDIKVTDEPEIKKIEEDEFVMPKKSRKQKKEELRRAKERLDNSKKGIRRVSLEDED